MGQEIGMNLDFETLGHDTPGIDLQILGEIARRAAEYGGRDKLLEIGSFAGLSTSFISDLRAFRKIYCVDTWQGNQSDSLGKWDRDFLLGTFLKNMGGEVFDSIVPLIGTSQFWSKNWQWGKFNFIWVDGDHTHEGVLADIKGWWPHLCENGTMAGHDWGVFPGVQWAVESFFGNGTKTLRKLNTKGRIWWIQKVTPQ